MIFGGWARERDEMSEYSLGVSDGTTEGIKAGFNDAISRAQLTVSQSLILNHDQKIKLWDELEKLRR